MKELQKQSEIWGDVALVLGIVTYCHPGLLGPKVKHGILKAPPEGKIWMDAWRAMLSTSCRKVAARWLLAVDGRAQIRPRQFTYLNTYETLG